MTKINDKYLYLPEKYWNHHHQCEELIKQLEELILNEDYQKLKANHVELEGENDVPFENENILDFLKRTGKEEKHDEIVRNHTVYALIIDSCYFLQEALSCSKKMRLSVTFSLLRKPFVYNLVVLLRLIYDEGFLDKFINKESFDTNYIKDEKRQELIKMSLSNSLSLNEEHMSLIFDLIFNKKISNSIVNMSEKALHLSTTRNKANKTSKKSLNFIFSTFSDNIEMWDYLYAKLPLLIMYYLEVVDSLVFEIVDLDGDKINNRLMKRFEILNTHANTRS